MLLSDLVGRRLFEPTELPVGVITALVGAPYLLWLLAGPTASAGWGRRHHGETTFLNVAEQVTISYGQAGRLDAGSSWSTSTATGA